ncbi:hypothetical protein [Bowmanella pacifica]|uniref:Flagellar motor switch protein FliN-like C-terminal domain-containing protein n=1 Tax=Bowmanella pacifica TaxID=502051 RepID=A0A918DIZ0_9ALTE|nr:hypothetical protein [Bowmanella pacifica]GGO69367.1 hypothetical protein GCM10010982_20360 [Bowmanella pacifica]
MSNSAALTPLLKAQQTTEVQPYPLTREHRRQQQAQLTAKAMLADLAKALELECQQLFGCSEVEADLTLCAGSGLDVWLKEAGRLMLSCHLLDEDDESAFLGMDHTCAHHLADLCLGGEIIKQSEQNVRQELSPTELRVTSRLFQRHVQAIQQVIFKQKSALPARLVKQPVSPPEFTHLPCKVRLVLASEVLSWFIWLPVGLFATTGREVDGEGVIMTADAWQEFLVQGRVVMAQKRMTLSQLKRGLQGEVLPIELLNPARFMLHKQMLFQGQIAEENGSLAFQIHQTQE